MTVYDMCFLSLNDDDEMTIFDLETGKTVYIGSFADAKWSNYAGFGVCSYDIYKGQMCINIDTAED